MTTENTSSNLKALELSLKKLSQKQQAELFQQFVQGVLQSTSNEHSRPSTPINEESGQQVTSLKHVLNSPTKGLPVAKAQKVLK